jgi:hypothetical protein
VGPLRGGAHDLVNVADAGFAVSQTLPVVVALVAADEGQVVFIEQPEIHLHPRAQLGLAKAFGDWPVDFADVAMSEDEAYSTAALRRLSATAQPTRR